MASTALNLEPQKLRDFCRRWRVAELSLFGSVARGEQRPDSDIDLLVTFEPDAPWSLWDFVTMRDELVQLLGSDVDLVEESAIRNPFRRHSILRDKRVLYAA